MTEQTTKFAVSEYFAKTYGLAPQVIGHTPETTNLPYSGFVVARELDDGSMKSYIRKDEGQPFKESMAHKIINDEQVQIAEVIGTDDGKPVRDYIVVCKNWASSFFQPTVLSTVLNCVNVHTDFEVEVLFVFEQEYLLPVKMKCRTRWPGAISLFTIFEDIRNALEGDEEAIQEFFENCPNASFCEEDGEAALKIVVSSINGHIRDFIYTLDRESIEDLQRAIVSVRMISCDNVIETTEVR